MVGKSCQKKESENGQVITTRQDLVANPLKMLSFRNLTYSSFWPIEVWYFVLINPKGDFGGQKKSQEKQELDYVEKILKKDKKWIWSKKFNSCIYLICRVLLSGSYFTSIYFFKKVQPNWKKRDKVFIFVRELHLTN